MIDQDIVNYREVILNELFYPQVLSIITDSLNIKRYCLVACKRKHIYEFPLL